jgi:hypothetical protein
VPFLGVTRDLVASALSAALQLPGLETVAMTVSLGHEPGYRHANQRTGELLDVPSDRVIDYGPKDFSEQVDPPLPASQVREVSDDLEMAPQPPGLSQCG